MLLCQGDYIYTGITNDPVKRFLRHSGILSGGAKFTRSHKPLHYICMWECDSETGARKLEYAIKKLTRKQKIKLCETHDVYNFFDKLKLYNYRYISQKEYEKMNCKNPNLVGFIGAGNMGSAIIKGILKSDDLRANTSISVFDFNKEKTEPLAKLGVTVLENANQIVETCKYVFLAVRPQNFDELLDTIAPSVTKNTVFVSIAAGITAEYIQSKTNKDAGVILVMPNTPFLLGEGSTAMANATDVPKENFNIVKNIFESSGIVKVIDKNLMKEVITINSSSPAYIYLFAKGFIDYGKSVGISTEAATELFAKALIGSAKMITESGDDIDTLIKKVCSPGGTTSAGIQPFYDDNLLDTIQKACKACTKRAYELSK